MRWGVLAFGAIPVPVFVGLAGSMSIGAGAVVLGGGLLFCVVQVWFLWHMLEAAVAPRVWTPAVWRRFAVLAVVGAVVTAVLVMLPDQAALLWAYPLVLAVGALALGQRFWQMLVSMLAVEAVLAVAVVGFVRTDNLAGTQGAFGWLVLAPLLIFTTWSSAWMLRVMADLREAREAAAWVATNEERGRISRDLHDLFGQTLSTIAVKSELAAELARRGRTDEAVAEMRQVHELSRDSGERVRAVVRGDRGLDLHSEIVGARAVLQAAGIDCHTSAAEIVDEQFASKLAWTLREAVTNILRHSDARTVSITLTADPPRLEIRNDHPHPMAQASGGLHGIRDRLESVGGVVEWRHSGDEFVLEVSVPDAAKERTAAAPGRAEDPNQEWALSQEPARSRDAAAREQP